LKSNGQTVDGIDWRANRLVDALAERAAGTDRALQAAKQTVAAGAEAAVHAACLVGCTAYAANHCKTEVMCDGGKTQTIMRRDSAPPARASKAGTSASGNDAEQQPQLGPVDPVGAAAKAVATPPRISVLRRELRCDHAMRQQVASDVSFQQWWRCAKALAPARPPEVSASERREALRSRLQTRLRAGTPELEMPHKLGMPYQLRMPHKLEMPHERIHSIVPGPEVREAQCRASEGM